MDDRRLIRWTLLVMGLSLCVEVRAAQIEILLDEPVDPPFALALEKALDRGQILDVSSLRGKIVILRAVAPECGHWRGTNDGIAPYRQLYDQYRDQGVVFLPIRTDFGHRTYKAYNTRLGEASQYCRKMSLPGTYLVDNDRRDFLRFVGITTVSLKDPQGGPPGWAYMCILDSRGRIVCRQSHSPAFQYHSTRMVLDRLLDPAFDSAYRRGFPAKPRTLPIVQRDGETLVFRDDFETYRDDYEFVLQPRWGFERMRQVHQRGQLERKSGRHASGTVLLKGGHALKRGVHNIEHSFPQPLRNGYVRFFIHRRTGWDRKAREFLVLRASLYAGDSEPTATIEAKGVWQNERFALNQQSSKIRIERDAWHEIRVSVGSDKFARVSVDGMQLGEFATNALTRVGFNCGPEGYYLDDFELSYTERR